METRKMENLIHPLQYALDGGILRESLVIMQVSRERVPYDIHVETSLYLFFVCSCKINAIIAEGTD